MKSNDTISVIEKLVFVYENLNILNNEFIREHLDFAIKSIKNMDLRHISRQRAMDGLWCCRAPQETRCGYWTGTERHGK